LGDDHLIYLLIATQNEAYKKSLFKKTAIKKEGFLKIL